MKNVELKNILREIAAKNGGTLHPEAVVEFARPESSPIHHRFTWDDSEAAKRYRLWQARELINVVVDYVKTERTQSLEVRAFVSLPKDRTNGGGYREITAVMANRDYRQQLLADAFSELTVLESKYKMLTELAEVFQTAHEVYDRTRSNSGNVPVSA